MYIGKMALTVLVMLVYAVPGYIIVKTKFVKSDIIPDLSKILLYVLQPFLTIYSFQRVSFSFDLLKNMGIFFGLSTFIQIFVLVVIYLLLKRKYADAKFRIFTIAATFGNVGFLGVPLLEAFLPNYPEAIAFSSVYHITMNTICWTIGSYIITGDKKFISFKKLIFNPPLLALFVALPLFFAHISLPTAIMSGVTVAGKATAPISMLILGMRFATVNKKELFTDKLMYLNCLVKLVAFPLLSFLLVNWLPIAYEMKATLFILGCCPTATVVQNLAEIFNNGQKFAANVVLMGTLLTIVTIPLMLLIL